MYTQIVANNKYQLNYSTNVYWHRTCGDDPVQYTHIKSYKSIISNPNDSGASNPSDPVVAIGNASDLALQIPTAQRKNRTVKMIGICWGSLMGI